MTTVFPASGKVNLAVLLVLRHEIQCSEIAAEAARVSFDA